MTPEQRAELRRLCEPPPEEAEPVEIPLESLAEYIASLPPPGPFVPRPWFDREWNAIHWYWKNDADYHEAVMIDDEKMKKGKRWVGSICRGHESKEPVGMEIFIDGDMKQEIANHYQSDFEKTVRTALPALLDYVETMEGEIARWRTCCEVGVTDPDYKLTITIEATAPAAAHSFCGKGSTVAEAVRSLGDMMGKAKEVPK